MTDYCDTCLGPITHIHVAACFVLMSGYNIIVSVGHVLFCPPIQGRRSCLSRG